MEAGTYFRLKGGTDVYRAARSFDGTCDYCCAKGKRALCKAMPQCTIPLFLNFYVLNSLERAYIINREYKIEEYESKCVE